MISRDVSLFMQFGFHPVDSHAMAYELVSMLIYPMNEFGRWTTNSRIMEMTKVADRSALRTYSSEPDLQTVKLAIKNMCSTPESNDDDNSGDDDFDDDWWYAAMMRSTLNMNDRVASLYGRHVEKKEF